MPRVKRVNSLFDMSIDFITENMDKFCKKMSTVSEIDVVKQERNTNVFSLLREYDQMYGFSINILLLFDFLFSLQLYSFLFY